MPFGWKERVCGHVDLITYINIKYSILCTCCKITRMEDTSAPWKIKIAMKCLHIKVGDGSKTAIDSSSAASMWYYVE